MTLGHSVEAEQHLLRARSRFERFRDYVRRAQVNGTLARLYTFTERYDLALECVSDAVLVLEKTDEEALVSEALTTKAVVLGRLHQFKKAKATFADAYKVSERCGNQDGCATALLLMLEETCEELDEDKRRTLGARLRALITSMPQTSLMNRFQKVRDHLIEVHSVEFS